jgi:hypothetical protein
MDAYCISDQSSPVIKDGQNTGIESQRYIIINKEIIPYKDIYLPGDNITILVEIKILKYRDMAVKLENLSIYELIDSNLLMGNKTNLSLKLYNIDDLEKYRKNLARLDTDKKSIPYNISWSANYGKMQIDKMNSWDRLIYWYNVTPRFPGAFSVNTIVRSPYQTDTDQILRFDVSDSGLYQVDSIPTKNRIYQGERLKVNYVVTYMGAGSNRAAIRFEIPNQSYFETYNKSDNITKYKNFNKYESVPIPREINYLNKGIYQLPGIWIDGRYFASNKDIIVDSFYERHWQFLQLLILIGAIFSGILVFIKYTVELTNNKNGDEKVTLKKLMINLKDDLKEIIDSIHVNHIAIIGAVLIAFCSYSLLCMLYPNVFVNVAAFTSENSSQIQQLLLIVLILSISFFSYRRCSKYGAKWILILSLFLFIILLLYEIIIFNKLV